MNKNVKNVLRVLGIAGLAGLCVHLVHKNEKNQEKKYEQEDRACMSYQEYTKTIENNMVEDMKILFTNPQEVYDVIPAYFWGALYEDRIAISKGIGLQVFDSWSSQRGVISSHNANTNRHYELSYNPGCNDVLIEEAVGKGECRSWEDEE